MDDQDAGRRAAIERLENKRGFRSHVVIYLMVNTMLVVIWAVSGTGYFWPLWPILGWGVGLVFKAWAVFGQRPITEDDIRNQMQRNTSRGSDSAGS